VLNNDAANKVVVNSNQDIVVQGGDGDDSISTASGADSVVTGTGNDSVTTGAGGDEVTVSASKTDKDTVDTGTGVDRVILQGDLSASDVGDDVGVTTSGGDLVITLPSGQSVTVKNGEIIEFADGTAIAAVRNDTEAAVMRLYEGFIGRPMDADGAAWWLSSLRDNPNKTIQDVVRAFAGEAETQAIMNSRTNNLFLDALYNKAFGRSGDEAGTEFWLSQLASGKASRVDLVASFMFSSEAEATIVGVIEIPGSL
jgi:Ca2+-binding RTX toxin-like protein